MMRRRFLGHAAAITAWPLIARAQSPGVPIVGFFHPGSLPGREKQVAAFREALAEAGFVEGRNLAIDFYWADGPYERLPQLATDLVHRQVAVIAATALPSAVAARQATATIPIVFLAGDDPIKHGLVASLNHPGANDTGVSLLAVGLRSRVV